MSSCLRGRTCTALLLRFLISLVVGVVAGFLFLTFFVGVTNVYWISFGIAAGLLTLALVAVLFARLCCRNRTQGLCMPLFTAGVGGLLSTSIIGVSIAVVQNPVNAVLFGFNAFFLVFVLTGVLQYLSTVGRFLGLHDGETVV